MVLRPSSRPSSRPARNTESTPCRNTAAFDHAHGRSFLALKMLDQVAARDALGMRRELRALDRLGGRGTKTLVGVIASQVTGAQEKALRVRLFRGHQYLGGLGASRRAVCDGGGYV